MPAMSLHLRLTGVLSILLAIMMMFVFILVDFRATNIARRDVDGQLKAGAKLTLQSTSKQPDQVAFAPEAAESLKGDDKNHAIFPAYEISKIRGRIISKSPDFPSDMRGTKEGFSDEIAAEQNWRVLTVQDDDHQLSGRVAINSQEIRWLANTIRSDILMPLVPILLLLAIAMLAAVWIGLRPLRRIEGTIRDIDPTHMRSLEIDSDSMPRELSQLILTLNELIERLQKLVRHQKAFVSATGHELRTPLAGCMAQLEVARRTTDPDDKKNALHKLDQGLHSMDTLVRQLLVIARSEQSSLDATRTPLDLADLLKRIVDDLPSADARVVLSTEPGPIRISGHLDLIGSMVSNLIANAVRVSAPEETVEIHLDRRGETACIRVCDRGPGLSEDQKTKVLGSFYSGSDGSGPGTGLGLAIVQAVAAAHLGTVTFVDRDPSGLCVEITLPVLPSSRRPTIQTVA